MEILLIKHIFSSSANGLICKTYTKSFFFFFKSHCPLVTKYLRNIVAIWAAEELEGQWSYSVTRCVELFKWGREKNEWIFFPLKVSDKPYSQIQEAWVSPIGLWKTVTKCTASDQITVYTSNIPRSPWRLDT